MIENRETRKWESKYWHPAVTADAVVFGFDGERLNLLLIERGGEPFKGAWALPGGFIDKDDPSAEAAAYRELYEETGIKDIYLEELKTFSDIGRDPRERVITIAFIALVAKNKYRIKGGDDAKEAKWCPVDNLPRLAFDHGRIIKTALNKLRQKAHNEPIGIYLLNKEFTLSQLQSIYSAILTPSADNNKNLNKRNFANKMLKSGYIIDTGKRLTGHPHNAAKLYSFDEEKYNNAKTTGMQLML